jgi:hypothetical protein
MRKNSSNHSAKTVDVVVGTSLIARLLSLKVMLVVLLVTANVTVSDDETCV